MRRSSSLRPSRSPRRASPLALALVPLAALSCATDETPPPARVGAEPLPVRATPDAAPTHTPSPAAGDAGARKAPIDAKVSAAFIYNRVLAKLDDPDAVDLAAFERDVEARTGAQVKEIRKGPMGLLSIVFEEASPPRGEAEQRALVEQLKDMPQLRYAEPERLLQAR